MSDELAVAQTEPGTAAAVDRRAREACLDEGTALALAVGTLPGELRTRATEHLDSCDDCRALVATVAVEADGADAGYQFGPELARGGMGRVLVARDVELDREVAIKQLLDDSPALRARFEREVRITAALQHPGIVPVYRAGALKNGEPFYVMRRIVGRSFDAVIAEATTMAARLALLPRFLAVAQAMAYAHARRVIHRDLKPHNVLIGDYGETVVVDWGLAKRLDHEDDEPPVAPRPARSPAAPAGTEADSLADTALTRAGAVLGTAAYMAPEQASGEAVDLRTDVYALGAMLYHLLAGAPPHAAPTFTLALAAITEGRVTPLATRAPDVPADLAAIVTRAMALAPADRYPDADGLARDVQTFLAGKLVAAHAYTLGELARRWLRRHRTAVLASAALVVGLGVIATVSFRRVRAERDRAETQRAASEALVGFILDDLRPRVAAIDKLPLLEGVNEEVMRYYRALRPSSLDATSLRRWSRAASDLADVRAIRGDPAGARARVYKVRVRLRQAAATELFPIETRSQLALIHVQLGGLAQERGALDEARRAYEQALEVQRTIPVLDPTQVAAAHRGLGDVAAEAGQPEAAIASYARSRAILAAGPLDEPWARLLLLAVLRGEGSAHLALGHLAPARAAFTDMRARAAAWAAAFPDDDLELERARAEGLLATVAQAEGDQDAALAGHQRVVEEMTRLTARDPSNTSWKTLLADAHAMVALAAYDLDRYDVMRAANAQELALWSELAAGAPGDAYWEGSLSRAHYRLGLLELESGQPARAADAFTRAVAGARRQATANATVAADLSEDLDALAEVERGRGAHPAALAAIDEGLEVVRRWKVTQPSATFATREVMLLISRARTYQAMGDLARARAALEEARAAAAAAPPGSIEELDRAALERALAELPPP